MTKTGNGALHKAGKLGYFQKNWVFAKFSKMLTFDIEPFAQTQNFR